MFFKIQKSEKDQPKSPFFQFNQTTLYFALFTLLQSHTQQTPNKPLLIVFYLVNLILENSIVSCRFDIRSYGQIITSNTVHLSYNSHQDFGTIVGEQFHFLVKIPKYCEYFN